MGGVRRLRARLRARSNARRREDRARHAGENRRLVAPAARRADGRIRDRALGRLPLGRLHRTGRRQRSRQRHRGGPEPNRALRTRFEIHGHSVALRQRDRACLRCRRFSRGACGRRRQATAAPAGDAARPFRRRRGDGSLSGAALSAAQAADRGGHRAGGGAAQPARTDGRIRGRRVFAGPADDRSGVASRRRDGLDQQRRQPAEDSRRRENGDRVHVS